IPRTIYVGTGVVLPGNAARTVHVSSTNALLAPARKRPLPVTVSIPSGRRGAHAQLIAAVARKPAAGRLSPKGPAAASLAMRSPCRSNDHATPILASRNVSQDMSPRTTGVFRVAPAPH